MNTVEETVEIIYLIDDNDADNESEGREDDGSYIYFENDLYKDLSYRLLLNSETGEYEPTAVNLDEIDDIDLNNDDSNRFDQKAKQELLRQKIDESFDADIERRSIRTKIINITATTFSVGIASYLVRAGSMVASLVSTLPMWHGFDPIAIFTADKKNKKGRDEKAKTDTSKAETFFDGTAK
jgi:hypothetical protein